MTPSTPSKLSLNQTLFFVSMGNVEQQSVVSYNGPGISQMARFFAPFGRFLSAERLEQILV